MTPSTMMCGILLALLSAAGPCLAGVTTWPEPQSGMIVLPKGQERSAYPGQAFMGTGVKEGALGVVFDWNDEGLAVTFDCGDTSMVAVQGDARDNANAWKDDCVEILLDPGHRHGQPVLVRASAAGALWDARGTDAGYTIAGLTSRVTRTTAGWRARIGIPWTGLGVQAPQDGEVWGLNLRRVDQTGSFALKTMAESSWMPQQTDPQDVLGSGHVAFIAAGSAEDDDRLAAMRRNLAAGHDRAIRAWAGPNDGDVVVLGSQPVAVPRFGRVASGVPARQATTATVSRNAEALVVDFDCEDADVVAVQEGRDGVKLWKDDGVYVWLDPAHDHQAAILVQLTAGGVVLDSKGRDTAWNLEGLETRVGTREGGWRAHLVIPFKGLGVEAPKDGALWGFNLSRMDQPGAYDYARMQMSSLATVPGGDLGLVHRWGHLAFGKAGEVAAAASHTALRKSVGERLAAEAAANEAECKRLAAYRGVPANPDASEDVYKIVKWFSGLHTRKENRFLLANSIGYLGTVDGKDGYDAGYLLFAESIYKKTGKWLPMIHVSYEDPSNPVQLPRHAELANRHAIAYWKAGGLVTIHVNPGNPMTGVVQWSPDALKERERIAEVLQPGSPANLRWLQTLDAWAGYLTGLRDAGVVVLWRPLHEMGFDDCYWYDWGASKSGEVYKKIWRHMFRYYSEEKKLDNLVWVWGGGGAHSLEMYPGPEYVDMVGFSHYGSEVVRPGNEYEHMLRYNKPIAFTEFGPAGNEEPPFDNLNLIRAVREQYPMMNSATYWYSQAGSRLAFGDGRNVEAVMNHPWVIDRSELDWRTVQVDREQARARKAGR